MKIRKMNFTQFHIIKMIFILDFSFQLKIDIHLNNYQKEKQAKIKKN